MLSLLAFLSKNRNVLESRTSAVVSIDDSSCEDEKIRGDATAAVEGLPTYVAGVSGPTHKIILFIRDMDLFVVC